MDGMNKWHVGESFILYEDGKPFERVTIREVLHHYFTKETYYKVLVEWCIQVVMDGGTTYVGQVEEKILRETLLKERYDRYGKQKTT